VTDLFYFASKIFWFVARPTTAALILGCLGLWAVWRGRRWGRWPLLACLGFFVTILATPIPSWLTLPLEDRFPRPAAPARVDGIVVLGGAVDQHLTAARGIPALNGAAERMTEAVALARRYPAARIVFAGGTGTFIPGAPTESDVARQLFTALGLPPERVLYESASRNTHENAVNSLTVAAPRPGETWLLVTSASHMPRAMGVFRRAGWQITAWPVNFTTGHDWASWYDAPFPQRVGQFEWAFREWIGLLAYRLTGRTDSLLPAP